MSRGAAGDPRSLTPALLQAVLRAAYRELSWGLPNVARELARWHRRASTIPDQTLRADALDALDHKRTNTDGAAVFATLLTARNLHVLRLLAVYQALWDYLDSSVERHPTEANGRELHLALVDALEPGAPLSDYYRHHPCRDDDGYLVGLVQRCRDCCQQLPSYPKVQPTVVAEARLAQIQALNHLPDRADRDAALADWAQSEFPTPQPAEWFEITAAASASLVILPLLALSGDARLTDDEVDDARAVYWPWVTIATTMLDNYADQDEDLANGNHNYFSHYPTAATGVRRVGEAIDRATRNVTTLAHGERHLVIVASMIAMYLSKTSDRTATSRAERRRLAHAGGPLVSVLVPILRLWRLAYGVASR